MNIKKSIGKSIVLCLTLVSTWSCEQGPSAPSPSEPGRTPAKKLAPPRDAPESTTKNERSPSVASGTETPGSEAFRFQAPGRVVAIGDLHGDLDVTKDVLRLAGAIDEKGSWVGGNLWVVQTGDQIDRGDEDKEVLDYLEALTEQAKAAGGRLLLLNGNHETMNAAGDFRYVTEKSFLAFQGESRSLPEPIRAALPEQAQPRAQAFLPGGSYAKLLAERPVVVVVGDSVFAHGGVLMEHTKYGVDRINREVSAWLRGESPQPRIIASDDAPVWTRRFSEPSPSKAACDELRRVLQTLLVKRMVVGHTVQDKGITSACDDQVYRVDVGLSRHYGGETVSALSIEGSKVSVLQRKRDVPALPEAAE